MPHQHLLTLSTRGRGMTDITARVAEVVRASGVVTGLAHVFVQHTSCSLALTENADPDVRRDLETIFARLAPDGDPAYRHDLEGDDDMAAHA
ncbi:secondary thiamine-phosphate synthase enzyme YjbQ, partial [Zoogloea sp.]|uniref:secondary thiamine-phosphate synthase enzyme YjbQ n=1 Tax=Zoogloea sp. TaxID=49181 RepID=UPI00321FB41E